MHGFRPRHKVKIKPLHIERGYRSGQEGDVLKHFIQRLVCCELVMVHFPAPESLPVQAHIPVAEMVAHKILDKTPGCGDVIILICIPDTLDKRIQQRNDPSVNLRPLIHRDIITRGRVESVHISIEGEE